MGIHRGNDGVLKVGTNAVSEITGFEVTETAATMDGTALNDAWATNQAGTNEWAGQATTWWDETDTTGQQALVVGATATMKFYAMGTGTGATHFDGAAIVTQVKHANARNQTVQADFQFKGSGALTRSTS